jgi:hypothetical protein
MACLAINAMACWKFRSRVKKHYIALYVLKKRVVDEFRDVLSRASLGKGWIRFAKPERMDFVVLSQLLRRAAESTSAPC